MSDPIFTESVDGFLYCLCGGFMKIYRIYFFGTITGSICYAIALAFKNAGPIGRVFILTVIGAIIYGVCKRFRGWYAIQGWASF